VGGYLSYQDTFAWRKIPMKKLGGSAPLAPYSAAYGMYIACTQQHANNSM